MSKTTLVVLAAGMGSRFGGLKQMEPISEKGSVLLNFSVYDAKRAGFDKVVFIIKEELYEDFKAIVGDKIDGIEVEYVFQETASLPEGRQKPWGTGHAILCCKDIVKENFAVINADDYYGKNAFTEICKYLKSAKDYEFSMVAFELEKTLSENGSVARGICDIENGFLKQITERTKIQNLSYTEDGESWISLPKDTKVSMNLWGFTPKIFDVLEEKFKVFKENLSNPLKDELFLPFAVDECVQSGLARVRVFNCPDKWYGMTYREDIDLVKSALNNMIKNGEYIGL